MEPKLTLRQERRFHSLRSELKKIRAALQRETDSAELKYLTIRATQIERQLGPGHLLSDKRREEQVFDHCHGLERDSNLEEQGILTEIERRFGSRREA